MPFSTNRRRASSEIRLRVLLPSRMGSPEVVGRAGSYVNDRSQKMKGEAPLVKGGSGDRIRAMHPMSSEKLRDPEVSGRKVHRRDAKARRSGVRSVFRASPIESERGCASAREFPGRSGSVPYRFLNPRNNPM